MSSVCDKFKVEPDPPDPETKLGIAFSTIGLQPINGLRHPAEGGTCGWYLWCGSELSDEPDFFSPMHVKHIEEYLPEIMRYLDLPPGFRMLVDNAGYEDVWFDEALLDI